MYGFKTKLRTSKSYGINSDHSTLTFNCKEFDCEVKITTKNESIPLQKASELYITSKAFENIEDAECICEISSQALTITSALLDLGFDIPRLSAKSYLGKVLVDNLKREGVIVLNDNFGPDIYEYENEDVIKYSSFTADPVMLCSEDQFSHYFLTYLNGDILDQNTLLGLKIINETRQMRNILARYVLILSSIECVSKRCPVDSITKEKVNDLLKIIKKEDDYSEKQNLMSALGKLKKESISQACRRMMSDILGKEKGERFKFHYDNRSKIVHKGIIPDNFNLGREEPELRRLVIEFYKKLIDRKESHNMTVEQTART